MRYVEDILYKQITPVYQALILNTIVISNIPSFTNSPVPIFFESICELSEKKKSSFREQLDTP